MGNPAAKTEADARGELVETIRRWTQALVSLGNVLAEELGKESTTGMVVIGHLMALEIERRRVRCIARDLGITDEQMDSYVAGVGVTIKRKNGEVLDHG